MKKLIYHFVILCFAVFSHVHVNASHLMGSEMWYEYTGAPNTYLVTAKIYRSCNGVPAGSQVIICWNSDTLGINGSTVAPFISFITVPNSACVTSQPICFGGIGDFEIYTYETVITLPQSAPDWKFSFSECCHYLGGTTLVNGGTTGMLNFCTLNNSLAPTNSSPKFAVLPFNRFCVGSSFYNDQGAFENDGDSLVYTFTYPEENNWSCPPIHTPAVYNSPYGPANPMASTIPITLNSSTGIIHFVPAIVHTAVICVIVSEYRNGILIGQIKREILFEITPTCNPISPSFENNILTYNGGQILANCNDYSVIIPFDTSYQCNSVDPSDFRVLTPFGIPNPIVNVTALNCISGHSDSLKISFLNPLTYGETFVWVKRGFDGNTILSECGMEMSEFIDTVRIVVNDNSPWISTIDSLNCLFNTFNITLTDSIYCFSIANDGSDFMLVDGSGNNYPITNVNGNCTPGLSKTNQLQINLSNYVNTSGSLYLLLINAGGSDGNTIANTCGRFLNSNDTLTILNISSKINIDLGSDQTICANGNYPILSLSNAGIDTYQWLYNSTLIANATSSTYQTTQAGIYSVQVAAGGCVGDTTMELFVIQNPTLNLTDVIICNYEPIPTINCGVFPNATYQWFDSIGLIPGVSSSSFKPTAAGIYYVEVTIPPGCKSTDTMSLIINTAPILAVADQDICSDEYATLDAGVAGANYSWSTGANTQTISTNQSGVYIVAVEINNCSSSDTVVVNVHNRMQAPIVSCVNGTGVYQYIFIWTSILGANSYEVSEDGGATWIPANLPSGNESHGVNMTIVNFQVRAIGTGFCSIGLMSDPIGCEVTIGNIFTPNEDGTNDFFEITNIEQYPNNTVQILNRFGKKVYDQYGYNNHTKKWDGKNLPEGIYFYLIDLGNGLKAKSGTITIRR